jgi:hypothetical protein
MEKEKTIVGVVNSLVNLQETKEFAAPELGWGPISDVKTTKVMNKILDIEKPNLTVLNGDLITGENTYFYNSTKYLDIIVGPLVKRNIPWASAYGNHDHQFNLSTKKLLVEESKYRLSLTKDMVRVDDAGSSNYVLPIFGSKSQAVPEVLLWFFDSRGGRNYQVSGSKAVQPGIVHIAVSLIYSLSVDELLNL